MKIATTPRLRFSARKAPRVARATAFRQPTPSRAAPVLPAKDWPLANGKAPELDYRISYDNYPKLVEQYKDLLVPGADMISHLELETKWKVDVSKIAEFKQKLDALAAASAKGDTAAVAKALNDSTGEWKVTANTRFVGDPMVDNYDDDPATLAITQAHGVFR